MQELIIIVMELFLHYFRIDSPYATASEVIRQLFGLSVTREVILSSFASGGRQADRKNGWYSMRKHEKSVLSDCFNDLINSGEQYGAQKSVWTFWLLRLSDNTKNISFFFTARWITEEGELHMD